MLISPALSKLYRAAYYGLLVAIAVLTVYTFYEEIFRHLEIDQGRLCMAPSCIRDSSLWNAGYWFCFSCLVLTSLVGLWLKKRWAYFLFHWFGVPALVGLLAYVGFGFSTEATDDWAYGEYRIYGVYLVYALEVPVLLLFVVLLNGRRKVLFGPFRNGWRMVLVGLAGVFGNLLVNFLVSLLTYLGQRPGGL